VVAEIVAMFNSVADFLVSPTGCLLCHIQDVGVIIPIMLRMEKRKPSIALIQRRRALRRNVSLRA